MGFAEAPALVGRLGLEYPKKPLVEAAMGSILACALIAHRDGCGVSYSRRKVFYSGLQRYHEALSLRVILEAVDLLAEQCWVLHEKAQPHPGGSGRQSRFLASDKLIQAAGETLFGKPQLQEIIRLHGPTGGLMQYADTDLTRQMRRDLEEANEDNRSREIVLTHSEVIRLDNGLLEVPTKNGDGVFHARADANQAFRLFKGDFEHHGRFYGPWWQNLPKHIRATIQIDGAPVSAADFGQSHFRIAYGEAGVDPGRADAYLVKGYETESDRKLVKLAAQVAINDTKGQAHAVETVAWEIAKADRRRETGSDQGAQAGPFDRKVALDVIEAVEDRHNAIRGAFYTGAGLRFMAKEAEVIAGVTKAARRYNIPVLSIHDEIIVPDRHKGVAIDLMQAEWRKRIPVEAVVR